MTVKEIINQFKSQLAPVYNSGEMDQVISLTFNDVLHFSKTDLIIKREEPVNESAEKTLLKYLDELKQNKPLQYVLGYSWFYGMKFFVNEHVLIPRPETEELVNWIISEFKIETSTPKILDIGTGSGCIAIALKENLPDCEVYAIDVSEDALKVANRNADVNKVHINFIHSDILQFQTGEKVTEANFDIIVSNPPYVRRRDMTTLNERKISYEPHLALFVEDDDPLVFYQAITNFASAYLKKEGKLYFEINELLGKETVSLLQKNKFKDIVLKRDMSGNDRMVRAVK